MQSNKEKKKLKKGGKTTVSTCVDTPKKKK